MSESITITLTTPVEGPDGLISALTLREPKGKDIRQAGVPFSLVDGQAVVDSGAATRLITALSGTPPFVADRLSAADWTICMMTVVSFFEPPTPPTS